MFADFFRGKRVFVTGHTGFKGSWLCLWLHSLGADVTGYALEPPTSPSLFEICGIEELVTSVRGDIRDINNLTTAMKSACPEIVIHMAAQPLVRDSYSIPRETYEINVMGAVNLFEAVRQMDSVKAAINVTTDKCYENREWLWGYREDEPLGGYDPYSSSKACSELITSAYRNSFFNPENYRQHGVALASVRAGNVIGGGDWAADRLIPDCVRALLKEEDIVIRNPDAIRPWQHVLEPLCGYLHLAEKLFSEGCAYAGAWNFGSPQSDARPVGWVVEMMCRLWGKEASVKLDSSLHPHEATYLKLDCSKAIALLKWSPVWTLDRAIEEIISWTKAYQENVDMRQMCLKQINNYTGDALCRP